MLFVCIISFFRLDFIGKMRCMCTNYYWSSKLKMRNDIVIYYWIFCRYFVQQANRITPNVFVVYPVEKVSTVFRLRLMLERMFIVSIVFIKNSHRGVMFVVEQYYLLMDNKKLFELLP